MYRNVIGRFIQTGRNCQFKLRNFKQKTTKNIHSDKTFLMRFILLFLLCNVYPSNNLTNYQYSPNLSFYPSLVSTPTSPCKWSDYMTGQSVGRVNVCWSHRNETSNKLMHSLDGNRRIGYKIGFWNCRKKLISNTDFDTHKLSDIKSYFT